MPADPLGEIKIIKRLDTIDTGGNCLDIDVSDSILVAAANYNGFIIFNLYDSSGNFNPKQKYHGSDLDPNTANDQISKVEISDSLAVMVLMDMYHQHLDIHHHLYQRHKHFRYHPHLYHLDQN